MEEIFKAVLGQLGVGAILGWYMYHTSSKTIPDMQEKHAEAVEKLQDNFATLIREEREECNRKHTENRQDHQAIMASAVETRHEVKNLAQEVKTTNAVVKIVMKEKLEEQFKSDSK